MPNCMIVIYTGDIERKQVSDEYNIGAVRMIMEPAFLSELDSGELFRHLKEKVEENELLSDEELMEFIILPLSYRKKEEKKEKIRESVNLASQIQDRKQQIFALAGILTFTDKLIDMKTANILQTARIYIDASEKIPGWRSAVGLHCKFNRRAV